MRHSEIWGSGKETSEGLKKEADENLYDDNWNREFEFAIKNLEPLDIMVDNDYQDRLKLSRELIERAKKIKKLIDDNQILLTSVPNNKLNQDSIYKINLLSNTIPEKMAKAQTYDVILDNDKKLIDTESILNGWIEELKEKQELTKQKNIENEFNSYITTSGLQNSIYQCMGLISRVEDDSLKQNFNEKYQEVYNEMVSEFIQTHQVLNTRYNLGNLINELKVNNSLKDGLKNADVSYSNYNATPDMNGNYKTLYLDGEHKLDLDTFTDLQVCEFFANDNFDEIIKTNQKINERHIIKEPGQLQVNGEPISPSNMIIRKEEIISPSLGLDVKKFISNNANLFMNILNKEACDNFLYAMNIFINRLKNNQIKDGTGKDINTNSLGTEYEKEFLTFLLVNLPNVEKTQSNTIINYCEGLLSNNILDSDIFALCLKLKNSNPELYDRTLNAQVVSLDENQKSLIVSFINNNYPEMDLQSIGLGSSPKM